MGSPGRSRSPSPAPAAEAAKDDAGAGSGDASGEEVKLYVGNISFETTSESLTDAFKGFGGDVTDAFLPSDRNTGRLRGFAFVTLTGGMDVANKAIEAMDQADLDGRSIRVNVSKPREERAPGGGGGGDGGAFNAAGNADVKLYVGNISFDTTEDMLRDVFSKYGTLRNSAIHSITYDLHTIYYLFSFALLLVHIYIYIYIYIYLCVRYTSILIEINFLCL